MTVLATQRPPGLSRDDWQTPAEVLELVRRVGPIALDPCTSPDNPTGARHWCIQWPDSPAADGPAVSWDAPEECHADGLTLPWDDLAAGGLVYVNPPYSRGNLGRWAARCHSAALCGAEVIALVPVDTSTGWWHDYCAPPKSQAVCFYRGRLRFVGAPGPAPFASALVYWGPRRFRFADVFADAGAIWI